MTIEKNNNFIRLYKIFQGKWTITIRRFMLRKRIHSSRFVTTIANWKQWNSATTKVFLFVSPNFSCGFIYPNLVLIYSCASFCYISLINMVNKYDEHLSSENILSSFFFSFFPFPFVDVYRYRVVLFGDAGTGKTALVSQFMTSEYMHTYDASLGKFKEFQHSVFVHWCRCILFLRFTNKHWIFLNLSSTKRYKNAINDILSI